jgi:hypothetical protein
VDSALREDLLQVRTHGIHGQTELLCRLFDRLSLEQVSGDGGLGGGRIFATVRKA